MYLVLCIYMKFVKKSVLICTEIHAKPTHYQTAMANQSFFCAETQHHRRLCNPLFTEGPAPKLH